jgi:hypothetical protein
MSKQSLSSLVALLLAAGCGGSPQSGSAPESDHPSDPPPYWDEIDWAAMKSRPRLAAPIITDTPCRIEIDTPPLLVRSHVPYGTSVIYSSDPASSGEHYPYWLEYKTYDQDIDPRYYVHNLEHGAVVLMYQCRPGTDCSAQRDQMEAFVDRLPDDPRCDGSGVRVRAVIAPSSTITSPFAAATWGWGYTAECFDAASLSAFIAKHYDDAPEVICSDGIDPYAGR